MSTNYDWYIKADIKGYAGKWIAILDERVIASGYDAEKVYKQAKKKHPKGKPSLAKIPAEDVLIL